MCAQIGSADFQTRLFLPSWWVGAFENSMMTHQEAIDEKLKLSRVYPQQTSDELSALALIIGELQRQIVTTGSTTVTIDPEIFAKEVSGKGSKNLTIFQGMLQRLATVSLLNETDQGYEPVRVFSADFWRKSDNQIFLDLSLDEMARELLLGYANPYLDLSRLRQRKPLAHQIMGLEGPLVVWKSAWMELQGVEQLVFIRLEQAMQWACRWLHFDGVFGECFSKIFRDVKLPGREVQEPAHRLKSMVLILNRMGKKLCQHGVLKFQVDDNYLAFGPHSDESLQLLWQACPQKAFGFENKAFRSMAMARLHDSDAFDDVILSALSMNVSSSVQEDVRVIIHSLRERYGKDFFRPVIGKNSSAPIIAGWLFIEWMLRQQPAHPLPLPEPVRTSVVGSLTELKSTDHSVHSFEEFCQLVDEKYEMKEMVDTLPLATLAKPSSFRDGRLLDALHAENRSSVVRSSQESSVSKPEPEPNTQKLANRQNLNSDYKMRRIAADELKKIKETDPNHYEELKKFYMDSLDDNRKKLLNELHQRMQPEMFESHLKHNLVRFMVDNPNLWHSAKNRRSQKPVPESLRMLERLH